jgi:hypothetical protein
MGCCNSRLKETKEKSNFSGDNDSGVGEQQTINDLINSNIKKRQKSFLNASQRKLTLQNSEYL